MSVSIIHSECTAADSASSSLPASGANEDVGKPSAARTAVSLTPRRIASPIGSRRARLTSSIMSCSSAETVPSGMAATSSKSQRGSFMAVRWGVSGEGMWPLVRDPATTPGCSFRKRNGPPDQTGGPWPLPSHVCGQPPCFLISAFASSIRAAPSMPFEFMSAIQRSTTGWAFSFQRATSASSSFTIELPALTASSRAGAS